MKSFYYLHGVVRNAPAGAPTLRTLKRNGIIQKIDDTNDVAEMYEAGELLHTKDERTADMICTVIQANCPQYIEWMVVYMEGM